LILGNHGNSSGGRCAVLKKMIVAVSTVAATLAVRAEGPYSLIETIIRPAIPMEPFYASRQAQGALYLAFEGEPMQLVIEVANSSDESHTLVTNGRGPEDLFRIRVKRDGQPVDASITIDTQAIEHGRASTAPVRWDERIWLAPRHELQIFADVRSPLEPGLYEFELTTTLMDADGKPLGPLGNRLPMEIRRASPETMIEIMRQRANRASIQGDFGAAEQRLTELFALAPNNVGGLLVRAEIALALRRPQEAAAAYDRAIAVLESDGDSEVLRWHNRREVDQMLSGLRSLRRGLQP
jgi:hypothetical protein